MAQRDVVSYCRICEALCGMVVTVEDNRIVKVRGDEQHPVSRGYLCPKGAAMAKVVTDPDRVVTPLRRTGGPGKFTPVGWDEALDDIAGRFNAIRERWGPRAVAVYFGNPSAFSLGALFWTKGFLDACGSPNFFSVGPQDTFGRQAASYHLYGAAMLFPIPDIPRTDFFLCMGANPLVSHGSLLSLPRIREELAAIVARGGRVVVVDPVRTKTAEAFEHVPVRPATDAWLLAAMLNVIFMEGLDDKERIAATAESVDVLATAVAPVTPALAEEATGIPAGDIVALARAFAGAPTACAYSRVGLNRNPQATVASFLLDALNVVTGNFDRAGGMVFGDAPIDFVDVAAKFGMLTFGTIRTRVSGLGDNNGLFPWVLSDEIITAGEGQVRALAVVSGNPVLSAPDGAALEAALGQLDLHVSLDLYVNETNRHADYILPAVTFFERGDFSATMLAHMPRPWLQATPAVIQPSPGGPRDDWEIIDEIVHRMGLGGPFSQRTIRMAAKVLRRVGVRITPDMMANALFKAGWSKWTVKKLKAHPHGVVERPHIRVGRAAKKIHRPGGKVNLAPAPVLEAVGRLAEPRAPVPGDRLLLVGRRELRSINSWLHNVRTVRPDGRPTLWLNPADAEERKLGTGDEADVTGPAGTITVTVEVTDVVGRGTVSYPHGWGHRAAGWQTANEWGGANINLIASSAPQDKDSLSGASHLDGIPVRLERCQAVMP